MEKAVREADFSIKKETFHSETTLPVPIKAEEAMAKIDEKLAIKITEKEKTEDFKMDAVVKEANPRAPKLVLPMDPPVLK